MMKYTGNEQLIKEYKKAAIESGMRQQDIAAAVGVSRQALAASLRKSHITFDDMQKWLGVMGYEIEFRFVKKGE